MSPEPERPPDGVHGGPFVVIDDARNERTCWGPFATVAEAFAWQRELIREYTEDRDDLDDAADFIDVMALFPVIPPKEPA